MKEVADGEEGTGEELLGGFGLVVDPLEVELEIFVVPHVLYFEGIC